MSITLPPLFDLPEATITITKDQLLAYGHQTAMVAIAVDRASRVPMCEAQLRELVPYWIGNDLVEQFGMLELMRAVEKHHGIGAKP